MNDTTQRIDSNNLSDDSYQYENDDNKTIVNSESTNISQCQIDDKQNINCVNNNSDSINFLTINEPSSDNNNVGKNKKPRKARSIFSVEQLKIMNDEFERHNYINNYTREELALRAGITPEQVKIWFQNMRSKKRKCNEKSRQNFSNIDFMPNPLQYHTAIYNEISNNIPQHCLPQFYTHNYFVNNEYPLVNYSKSNTNQQNSLEWNQNYQTPPLKYEKNASVSQNSFSNYNNENLKKSSISSMSMSSLGSCTKAPHNFIAPGFASTLYNAKLHNTDTNFAIPTHKPNNTLENDSNNRNTFKSDNSCNIQHNQKNFSSSTPLRKNNFQNIDQSKNVISNYQTKSKIPVPVSLSVPVPIANYSQVIQPHDLNTLHPNR